jgi:hypothetical protein
MQTCDIYKTTTNKTYYKLFSLSDSILCMDTSGPLQVSAGGPGQGGGGSYKASCCQVESFCLFWKISGRSSCFVNEVTNSFNVKLQSMVQGGTNLDKQVTESLREGCGYNYTIWIAGDHDHNEIDVVLRSNVLQKVSTENKCSEGEQTFLSRMASHLRFQNSSKLFSNNTTLPYLKNREHHAKEVLSVCSRSSGKGEFQKLEDPWLMPNS